MNATTIYSKSGKGVQEASGKTSLLKRTDRAVLAAIDGRTTLGELARKLGKPYDTGFQQLIIQLDRNGFIREVSSQAPLSAASTTPRPIAPAAPADPASDLDFSALAASSPRPAAPPAQPPPEAKPAAPARPSVDAAKARADAERRAKEQEAALVKARQEAEERAHQERDRIKAEAEARMRAEMEAKLRAEAEDKAKLKANAEIEARLRAEAEAKVKAARETAVRAAAEAKARAEAELQARLDAERAKLEEERAKADTERRAREEAERRAKEEAERAREEAQRAREEAERARKQAEEKARREAEELRQKLEEERAKAETERRAREEAERKAKEEAQRLAREAEEKARREAEALRKQLEEERRQIEEERKRREEEDRARAQAEERARQQAEERARQQAEERARQQAEERRLNEEQEAKARQEAEAKSTADQAAATVVPAAAAANKSKFEDSLVADLDSFTQREDEERKAKEEADRRARAEAERKAKEQAERKAREQAERQKREEEERRRHEEEARRAREEEERKHLEEEDRKRRAEAERARKEAEERKRKAKEEAAKPSAKAAKDSDIGVSDEDLDMEDVRRDQRSLSPDARRAAREREAMKTAQTVAVAPGRRWRPRKWGKRFAIGIFILLLAAVGLLHVMPISTAEYEKAAAEALGQPVRIGSGHVSLVTGVQLRFEDVSIGKHLRAATVHAYPQIGSLFEPKKKFDRIELEGVTMPQQALGSALFSKMKGDNFAVSRIVIRQLKLVGPLGLPAVDADIELGDDGTPVAVTVHGPENLFAKLVPKASEIQFEANADRFTLPFASEVTLNDFGMRGTASSQGMNIASWNGAVLDGTVSGVASLRWGPSWSLDGTIDVHGMNAAVFAPALVSEGKADGSGRFLMSSPEPARLAQTSRIEGKFTIAKGVLGSIDLSRALQTSGRQAAGRTPFADLAGQGIYDKGAVSLRSITFAAGMLNAGVSADITQSGSLSGRIVADVKTSAQTLRATLNLGGTIKDPQVRN